MDANASSLLHLLYEQQVLHIPVYQRKYAWEYEQCQALIDDLENLVPQAVTSEPKDGRAWVQSLCGLSTKQQHFFGCFVLKMRSRGFLEGMVCQVVDGQQRLTTVMLFLLALTTHVSPEFAQSQLWPLLLRNSTEAQPRLELTAADQLVLLYLMQHPHATSNSMGFPFGGEHSRVYLNYRYFKKYLEQSETTGEQYKEALARFYIVRVFLDGRDECPQTVFESINATGKSLEPADLIRNDIFMPFSADEKAQEYLFNTYWAPLEQTIGLQYLTEFFCLFSSYERCCRALEQRSTINMVPESQVHMVFRELIASQDDRYPTLEALLDRVSFFARFFHMLTSGVEHGATVQLNDAFAMIRALKIQQIYPLLFALYEAKAHLKDCVPLVASFLLRRVICGYNSSVRSSFMLNLVPQFRERVVAGEKPEAALVNLFLSLEDNFCFPTDEEFKQSLQIKDIYSMQNVCHLILSSLDHSYNSAHVVDADHISIEHIMPQTINDRNVEWKEGLGEQWQMVHSKYLHTLGNLTLTGNNTQLSNKPFAQKLQDFYTKSSFNITFTLEEGQEQGEDPQWNEASIQRRAEYLAQRALSIWTYPQRVEATSEEA